MNIKDFFEKTYTDTVPNGVFHVYRAPGRVNLIGDHTDYNGGLVLPCAIHYQTLLMVKPRQDRQIRLRSHNFTYPLDTTIEDIGAYDPHHDWANYPLGVLQHWQPYLKNGADFYFLSNLPVSAGLSSSASILVLCHYALSDLCQRPINKDQLIDLAVKTERDYIGVPCGIMDQFVITQGQANHALYLDCGKRCYEHVPLQMGPYRLVIVQSNKKRDLREGNYAKRSQECQHLKNNLQKHFAIEQICDLPFAMLDEVSATLNDPLLEKRLRHILSENERVRLAKNLLCDHSLKVTDAMHALGKLMNDSHASLKNDFEVSCPELDCLVHHAQQIKGVAGARMTGAGFGGCTVNLVDQQCLESFEQTLKQIYFDTFGLTPEFYQPMVCQGVSKANCQGEPLDL